MKKAVLEGIRVIECAQFWVGPYTAEALAFLGAEVIKIESAGRIDPSRQLSLTTGQTFKGLNESTVFNDLNCNKLDITLDLKQPKSVDLVKRLAKISDIFLQNMRPGVTTRLGIDYDALKEVKPDIIYLSSSARGSNGPEKKYAGFAPGFSALSGLAHMTGYADGPPFSMAGRVDIISATTNVVAILAALVDRAKTGEGQHIDVSSSDSISVLIGDVFMDYAMNKRVHSRNGNYDDIFAPHNCYRCKGEDKWISIVVATEEEWKSFCNATGNTEWIKDSRFADAYARKRNEKELNKLISQWTANYTHYEIMELLQNAGIAAVPSFNSKELFEDPHLREREFAVDIEHPVLGKQKVISPPWKLSETPADVNRPSPLFGEHNKYVFGELLGMDDEEINSLIDEKVIY